MESADREEQKTGSRFFRLHLEWKRVAYAVVFTSIILLQAAFAIHGIDNFWQTGHNGYNGAAYHQAARNSLRFGYIFPDQYSRDYKKRVPNKTLYTHAPLGLHAHITASVWLFGDSHRSVRLVPAVNGLLATIALLVVVWRLWSRLHAAVAGAIFVLLPINHSFANMVNHSTGFIFWSLVTLACYLRWAKSAGRENGSSESKRTGFFRSDYWSLAAVFGASLMAMFWDWPAYYVMFAIAVHWLYLSYDNAHRRLGHIFGLNREHVALALFSLFVLANFIAFFICVRSVVGNFNEVFASINMRTYPMAGDTKKLWTNTLKPVFSTPLIALGLSWIFGFVVRHARKKSRYRDLVPIAFFFAGCLHILLFKRTAVIHMYWPWPLNPFIAIASASVLIWCCRTIASLVQRAVDSVLVVTKAEPVSKIVLTASALLVFLPFSNVYLSHTLPLIERGRMYAGVFHFPKYTSDYERVYFVNRVRELTTENTGVLIHKSFPITVQLSASLDRFAINTPQLRAPRRARNQMGDGWVHIGAFAHTSYKELIEVAAQYPYRQYGLYYMVDYRREGPDVQVHDLVTVRPSLRWKTLTNALIAPYRAVRNPKKEKRLIQAIKASH